MQRLEECPTQWVAAVAQAAGVSPDTIYVSLGGKQGLLEGVLSMARYDPEDPGQRDQEHRRDEISALTDPQQRLRRLVELSCETLARISPVHAVLRGAADGHPFAAELYARMLGLRLQLQAQNLKSYPDTSLRPGLTAKQAAEHYSALLSPSCTTLTNRAPGRRPARCGCGAGRSAEARDPRAPPAPRPAGGRTPERLLPVSRITRLNTL